MNRRLAALLCMLPALAGLLINLFEVIPSTTTLSATNPNPRSLGSAIIYFWTFYTHLSNLSLVLVYAAQLTDAKWLSALRHPVTLGGMAGHISLVMVYFHVMLAPLYDFEGALFYSNYLLHYAAPLLYLVWWVGLAPHGGLRFTDVALMLAPGLVYLALVLIRGAFVGEYPYAIIDVKLAGYAGVAAGASVLLAAVAVFCALLVLVDRVLGRVRA